MRLRPEEPADIDAVRRINDEAFGQPDEGKIVDTLRSRGEVLLSLVAVVENEPVGHILFTPLLGENGEPLSGGAALGPMAVVPGRQRRGVGSALVERGLAELRASGCAFAVVLGHPEYYPRFGFRPAVELGVSCEFEVPPEVFMALELEPGALRGGRVVRYQPDFSPA